MKCSTCLNWLIVPRQAILQPVKPVKSSDVVRFIPMQTTETRLYIILIIESLQPLETLVIVWSNDYWCVLSGDKKVNTRENVKVIKLELF